MLVFLYDLFVFLDFYNWNRLKVRYCDGASFTGDVEEVDPVSHSFVINDVFACILVAFLISQMGQK